MKDNRAEKESSWYWCCRTASNEVHEY